MNAETLQILQLVFTGIILPLMAWTLTEVIRLGRLMAAFSVKTETHDKQISELFDRVLKLESEARK